MCQKKIVIPRMVAWWYAKFSIRINNKLKLIKNKNENSSHPGLLLGMLTGPRKNEFIELFVSISF